MNEYLADPDVLQVVAGINQFLREDMAELSWLSAMRTVKYNVISHDLQ